MKLSIFGYVEPLELIEGHRDTPYHARRFGRRSAAAPSSPPGAPKEPTASEARYLAQLLHPYGDHLGRPCPAPSALDAEPQLRGHLARQREAFYRAESLREFERDTLADDSEFEAVKDEIHRGVIDVCEAPHPSGYQRVVEVTREARRSAYGLRARWRHARGRPRRHLPSSRERGPTDVGAVTDPDGQNAVAASGRAQ